MERQLTSDFSDYLHDNRTRSNPNIEVTKTEKDSHKYLILKLNNVREANEEFCKMIRSFRPGTKYTYRENSESNSFIHTVCIPFDTSRTTRSHHKTHKNHNQSDDITKPNIVNLLGAIIILMATIGIGQYVTHPTDLLSILRN